MNELDSTNTNEVTSNIDTSGGGITAIDALQSATGNTFFTTVTMTLFCIFAMSDYLQTDRKSTY